MSTPDPKDWLLDDAERLSVILSWNKADQIRADLVARAQLLKALKGVEEWLGSKATAYGASNVSEFHEWAGVMSRLANDLAAARERFEGDKP